MIAGSLLVVFILLVCHTGPADAQASQCPTNVRQTDAFLRTSGIRYMEGTTLITGSINTERCISSKSRRLTINEWIHLSHRYRLLTLEAKPSELNKDDWNMFGEELRAPDYNTFGSLFNANQSHVYGLEVDSGALAILYRLTDERRSEVNVAVSLALKIGSESGEQRLRYKIGKGMRPMTEIFIMDLRNDQIIEAVLSQGSRTEFDSSLRVALLLFGSSVPLKPDQISAKPLFHVCQEYSTATNSWIGDCHVEFVESSPLLAPVELSRMSRLGPHRVRCVCHNIPHAAPSLLIFWVSIGIIFLVILTYLLLPGPADPNLSAQWVLTNSRDPNSSRYKFLLRVGLPSGRFRPSEDKIDVIVYDEKRSEICPLLRLQPVGLDDDPVVADLPFVVIRLVALNKIESLRIQLATPSPQARVFIYGLVMIPIPHKTGRGGEKASLSSAKYMPVEQFVGGLEFQSVPVREAIPLASMTLPLARIPIPRLTYIEVFIFSIFLTTIVALTTRLLPRTSHYGLYDSLTSGWIGVVVGLISLALFLGPYQWYLKWSAAVETHLESGGPLLQLTRGEDSSMFGGLVTSRRGLYLGLYLFLILSLSGLAILVSTRVARNSTQMEQLYWMSSFVLALSIDLSIWYLWSRLGLGTSTRGVIIGSNVSADGSEENGLRSFNRQFSGFSSKSGVQVAGRTHSVASSGLTKLVGAHSELYRELDS